MSLSPQKHTESCQKHLPCTKGKVCAVIPIMKLFSFTRFVVKVKCFLSLDIVMFSLTPFHVLSPSISRLQGKIIKGAYRFHALITTFEMILTDCPELRSVPWRCVVIDEAHRLKNRNCKLLEGLKMMDMVSSRTSCPD